MEHKFKSKFEAFEYFYRGSCVLAALKSIFFYLVMFHIRMYSGLSLTDTH